MLARGTVIHQATALALMLSATASSGASSKDSLAAAADENLSCAAVTYALAGDTALAESASRAFVKRAAKIMTSLRGKSERTEDWVEFYTLAAQGRAEVIKGIIQKDGEVMRHMYEGMQDVCVSQVLNLPV